MIRVAAERRNEEEAGEREREFPSFSMLHLVIRGDNCIQSEELFSLF